MYVKTARHVHSDRNISHYKMGSVYVRMDLNNIYPIVWKFVAMDKIWDSWNVMTVIWRIEMVVVQID